MRLTTWITALIFFAAGISSASAQNTEILDRQMHQAMETIVSENIPGISIAIADRTGLLWSGAAGYSDIESEQSVSQSHLFGIGDISSQFVAAVIVQLSEEGLVDLNSTPAEILGNVVANIENADSATLLQLLNHTSGIYSWADDADWQRRGRGIQLNPNYPWRKEEQLKYITKDRHDATGIPGAEHNYSKSNYTILGLVAEKISGGLLEDEIKTRLLVPNNLKDTYLDTYQITPVEKRVGSYHLGFTPFISKVGINAKFEFGPGPLINTSGTTLSAEGLSSGMASTPRDVAIFIAKLWNGELIDNENLQKFKPQKTNGHTAMHSEILGFTIDVRQIEGTDIVLVSALNIGIVNTGGSETAKFIRNYVDNILLPIAKKYAK